MTPPRKEGFDESEQPEWWDEEPLLANLRNGEWLDAQNFPPLTFAVPGVIPEGSSLFVGPPKVGKSWFLLATGLAVACGGCALGGLKVEQRPVLYLALEDGDRRMKERCGVLLEGAPIPKAFEYITKVEPGTVIATAKAWAARHRYEEWLMMLDTLGKVMPPALMGESAYQRDYRIGSALKALADDHPGCSVLVNHHDRKAESDDFVDSVSGTNGLAGAADTILVLSRRRHEREGLLKVTGRDVAEAEYALLFEHDSAWRLDGTNLESASAKAAQRRASQGLGERSAEIITIVNEHPDGITPSQLAEIIGIDAHTAGTYLGRACDAGRVRRIKRGLYAPVESVESMNGNHSDSTNQRIQHPLGEPSNVPTVIGSMMTLRPGGPK